MDLSSTVEKAINLARSETNERFTMFVIDGPFSLGLRLSRNLIVMKHLTNWQKTNAGGRTDNT